MRTPPECIEVGDTLTQDEIEDAYNTGFGYRISGINPRLDDHDRRYILVFANEDGPYSDSVTQGRFEYIGEGLSGDQSEGSPGNSALIDARGSDIPVHFFYKRSDDEDWEYQGLVDVIDYEFQEQDGRKVLVFTLKHREKSKNQSDSGQPSTDTQDNKHTVTVDRISNSGNAIYEKGNSTFNLGPLSPESVDESVEIKHTKGTYLFCDPDKCEHADAAYVFHAARNMSSESFAPEEATVEVKEVKQVGAPPKKVILGYIGEYRPIQVSLDEGKEGDVVRVKVSSLDRFFELDGPIEAEVIEYLDSQGKVTEQKNANSFTNTPPSTTQNSDVEIDTQQTEIQQATESEPRLTDDTEQFTESRRRARDNAFTELVRDAYDEQCAICGDARETPDGNPEVEAAHIYPKHKGGSDDVRNGLALCKLHHWAFDTGWLSLSDDYEILVTEAPDRNGYHEFKQLEGDQIRLPDEDEAHPHPMFLEEHRGIHGFTDA